MVGFASTRGDSRLRDARARSVLRGADTLITIETGIGSDNRDTRAKPRKIGRIAKPPTRNRSRIRPNRRRTPRPPSGRTDKIPSVGTPDVGRDSSVNETLVNNAFNSGGMR